MTGTWQLLRSLLEARSVDDYKEDIFRYMTRRYGEHASDELRKKMETIPFGEWRKYSSMEYMDPKLDDLIDTLSQQARAIHKAKQGSKPEVSPGRTQGPSGRVFTDLGSAEERQAKIDAMRQARQAPSGGQSAAQALMTPGKSPPSGARSHAVGSAGQHQPKTQPSVAAGIRPQGDAVPGRKVSRSGFVRAQREVDRETREKGVAAGERLAKSLGVPTTAERTTIHPDTGEKRIQVWGPDRIFKSGYVDNQDVKGDSEDDLKNAPAFLRGVAQQAGAGRSVSLRGAAAEPSSKGTTDADRKAQAHKRALDAQAGRIDPDRLEKIKRGLLQRNAAATQVGPDRPPSFDGERWKPHGREGETMVSRPDAATGNWIRGKQAVNPKHTGAELVGLGGKWVTPSVYASNVAQRKAKGLEPAPASSDFEDDEKTDQDVPAFPED